MKIYQGRRTPLKHQNTIIEQFVKVAKQNPQKIALVCGGEKWTYEQLNEITNALAYYLKAQGVSASCGVGLLIGRNAFFPICALACLKIGAYYVPLDPNYPSSRIAYMTEDAHCKLVIKDKQIFDEINASKTKIITTEIFSTLLENVPEGIEKDYAITPNKSDDIFIVLYTSGTTGQPKGVMLSENNLRYYIDQHIDDEALTKDDSAALCASFGFDAHIETLWTAFNLGSTLHVISEELRVDLKALNHYFIDNNIAFTLLTTQLGRAFALANPESSLKCLLVGGEALTPFKDDEIPNYDFRNAYGPTECTVTASNKLVKQAYDPRVPIGRPHDNLDIYIVKKDDAYEQLLNQPLANGMFDTSKLKLAEIDEVGELVIAGPQVALGYINDSEKTNKVFMTNPFSNEPGFERMYRTGDLAAYKADGDIDILGRVDSQVKIRGFRVELTAIEKRILEADYIESAVVIDCDAPSGGKMVVAYVIPSSPDNFTVSALNEWIKDTLPAYFVPQYTIVVDQIPYTVNGKVDRKALPEPNPDANDSASIYDNDFNEKQKQIVDIIVELTNATNWTKADSLFEIGLTSLAAVTLASRIADEIDPDFSIVDFLTDPSLTGIFNSLSKSEDASDTEVLMGANEQITNNNAQFDASSAELYPLKANQVGLYYDMQKDLSSTAYNLPFLLEFSKNISSERLKTSLEKLIAAHSVLQTRLTTQKGEVFQYIHDEPISIDFSYIKEKDVQKLREQLVRPFNIFTEALARFAVLESEDKVYLFVDINHLIFDGASMDIFTKELATCFAGQDIKPECKFLEAAKEEKATPPAKYQKAKEYFTNKFADFEEDTKLAFDITNADNSSGIPASISIELDEAQSKFIADLPCSETGIFMGGFALLLSRFINQKSLAFVMLSSGRFDPNSFDAFGMYVQTIPFLHNIDSTKTVKDYINAIELDNVMALTNSFYPLTQISSDFNFAPKVGFSFQGDMAENITIGNETVAIKEYGENRAKFPIFAFIKKVKGNYVLEIEYDTSLYQPQTIQTLIDSYQQVILNLAKAYSKDVQIKQIGTITTCQRKVIDDLQIQSEPLEFETIPDMVFANADKTPDKIALIGCDGQYSFRQLDEITTSLAHVLIEKGVKPGDRVAIMLERKAVFVLSMLAVLKAGAAYIPVDLDYPKDRIDYIIEQSKARVFIVTPDLVQQYAGSYSIDELIAVCANYSTDKSDLPTISGDDLSNLIYTSGTTGRPKGVMLAHKSVVNCVCRDRANQYIEAIHQVKAKMLAENADNDIRLFNSYTVSFDMFSFSTFMPLCNGFSVIIGTEDDMHNPVQFAKNFLDLKANMLVGTPSFILGHLEEPSVLKAAAKASVALLAGEKFPPNLFNKLREQNPDMVILNGYGPSETTMLSNVNILSVGSTNIGRPISNTLELIMDYDYNPLPLGCVGELWIGGTGVSKGYFQRQDLTDERFIDFEQKIYYRSGDLCKGLPDGDYQVLGRNDSQVKLRGLRIELGEIENVLASYEGIKNFAVIIGLVRGIEQICAYFTSDEAIDLALLREHLASKLTNYMVPAAYLQMESLPKTPNGKVDKKALPEPELLASSEFTPPSNENEKIFCDLFQEITNAEKVGINDNFFDIGGTSLLATSLVVKASALGLEITYGDVFASSTPQKLAALVGGSDEVVQDSQALQRQAKIEDYDYSKINQLLAGNNLDAYLKSDSHRPLGNVLLTGSTGFLGAHILRDFLDNYPGIIYCLVRSGKTVDATTRLKSMLMYYFAQSFDHLFGNRIIVLDGDITNQASLKQVIDLPVDTIINSAASVKHFAQGDELDIINTQGVCNLIDIVKKMKDTRLIQISTVSVGGMASQDSQLASHTLNEHELYFGQDLSNKYVYSKFMAERHLLEAVAAGEIDGKILRVGNLMARFSDGEFQANFETNAFLGNLRGGVAVGAIAYEMLQTPVSYDPIDCTAHSCLVLGQTSNKCVIFHPLNNHQILLADIIQALRNNGIKIQSLESDDYKKALNAAFAKGNKTQYLNSLIHVDAGQSGKVMVELPWSANYTHEILYREGDFWPLISKETVAQSVNKVATLGFFDI